MVCCLNYCTINGFSHSIQGPVSGYRSVLRTFISAFIASYEINLQVWYVKSVVCFKDIFYVFLIWSALTKVQPEDSNPTLMLDILCKIYRGEVWMYNHCPSGHSLLQYHDIC